MALSATILYSIFLCLSLVSTHLILFYDTNIHITHSVDIEGIQNAIELAAREIATIDNSTHSNTTSAQYWRLLIENCKGRLDIVSNNFGKLDLDQHNTRYRRSTILNLGIISPYLGIASTAMTDHNSQVIKELQIDINAESSKVRRNMDTIARNMKSIQDFANNVTNNIDEGRFIFYHSLRLNQLVESLEHCYQEIIDILEAGDQNKPSRHMFDLNNLAHTLDNFVTSTHFPLYTKVNVSNIFRAAIATTSTTNQVISQTIKVPLIAYNDICTVRSSNVTCIHNLTATQDLQTCHRISKINRDLLCRARPCFYDPSIYLACTAITHNSFEIHPRSESTCTIHSNSIESLERLNASTKLTIPLSHHIICIGLEIHSSEKTISINQTTHLSVVTSDLNLYSKNSPSLRLEKIDRFNTTQTHTHTVSHTDPFNYTWISLIHSPILGIILILLIVIVALIIRYVIFKSSE